MKCDLFRRSADREASFEIRNGERGLPVASRGQAEGLLADESLDVVEIEIVESFTLVGQRRATPPDGYNVVDGGEVAVRCGVRRVVDNECRSQSDVVFGCRLLDLSGVVVACANLLAKLFGNVAIDVLVDVYHKAVLC